MQLHKLLKDNWQEILDFKFSLDQNNWTMPIEAYDKGEINVNTIIDSLNKVCELMRIRISES